MRALPLATVIIPSYQEKNFIGKCLDSIINNDYPEDRIEILVIDGLSTDGTRDIIEGFRKKYPRIKLLDNPARFQSYALNMGIKESAGEVVIRCDAHAFYPKDYISRLVGWLMKDRSLGSAGGVWVNVAAVKTSRAEAIAAALGSSLCVGPNKYRTGAAKPVYVDTVPFGAWRKEIFDKTGLFSEELLIGEDLEFNIRLRKAGFRILLDPGIRVYYYPRENFSRLIKMMYKYGYWKNFVNKKLKQVSSARQLFPPLFVLYLIILAPAVFMSSLFAIPALIYLIMVLSAGFSVSRAKKNLKLFPYCVFTFLVSHLGYGAGYIRGFWDFFVVKKSGLKA